MSNNKTLHYVALAFLAEHHGAYLTRDRKLLIERCINHLVDTQDADKRDAEIATLQAYGENESGRCSAYVDMALTTSHTIFIRVSPDGRERFFTPAELMDLVKTPALASLPVQSTRDLYEHGAPDAPQLQ
jgi:hypothetical protein